MTPSVESGADLVLVNGRMYVPADGSKLVVLLTKAEALAIYDALSGRDVAIQRNEHYTEGFRKLRAAAQEASAGWDARGEDERLREAAPMLVQMPVCDLCLGGKGGECHTPGCAFYLNRAPDLPLRSSPLVELVGEWDAYARVTDAQVQAAVAECRRWGLLEESEFRADNDAQYSVLRCALEAAVAGRTSDDW